MSELKSILKAYKSPLIHKGLVIAGSVIGAVAVGVFVKQPVVEEFVVVRTVTDPEDPANDTPENLS